MSAHSRCKAAPVACCSLAPLGWLIFPLANASAERRSHQAIGSKNRVAVDRESISQRQFTGWSVARGCGRSICQGCLAGRLLPVGTCKRMIVGVLTDHRSSAVLLCKRILGTQ